MRAFLKDSLDPQDPHFHQCQLSLGFSETVTSVLCADPQTLLVSEGFYHPTAES